MSEKKFKFVPEERQLTSVLSTYNVVFEGEMTLKGFMDAVLEERKDDSGYFRLVKNSKEFVPVGYFNMPYCAYSKGVCVLSDGKNVEIEGSFPADLAVLEAKIKNIVATGRAGRMDYTVFLEGK